MDFRLNMRIGSLLKLCVALHVQGRARDWAPENLEPGEVLVESSRERGTGQGSALQQNHLVISQPP